MRLHCFPRGLEAELMAALSEDGSRCGAAAAPPALCRTAPAALACLAHVCGYFYMGVEDAATSPAALLRVGGEGRADAVCRAQHKLREAAERSPRCRAALCAARGGADSGGLALDVGASPGGWVRALTEQPLRFGAVVAVDPGALQWDALPLCEERPAGVPLSGLLLEMAEGGGSQEVTGRAGARVPVLHLREQGASAIARLLLAAGGRRPFSAFTCDANVPTPVAAELFRSALPLLRRGALVCVTLKNFDGGRGAWEEKCGAAEAVFRGACEEVRMVQLSCTLQLFANAPQEVTLVGVVR